MRTIPHARIIRAPDVAVEFVPDSLRKSAVHWNYQKELLRIKADRAWRSPMERGNPRHIFSRESVLERPLLHAITASQKVALLIDGVDKTMKSS